MALMDEWCLFGYCFHRIIHAWKLLVLHVNQIEGLIGFPFRRRGNGYDGVANKAHAIYREHRLVLDLATVLAEFSDVVRRQHNDGSGYSRGIDFHNACARVRGTENAAMK